MVLSGQWAHRHLDKGNSVVSCTANLPPPLYIFLWRMADLHLGLSGRIYILKLRCLKWQPGLNFAKLPVFSDMRNQNPRSSNPSDVEHYAFPFMAPLWPATHSAAHFTTGAEGSFRPAFYYMLLTDYSYFSKQWPLLIIIGNKSLLKIWCLDFFSSQNYREGNGCLSSEESYAQRSPNTCLQVFSIFT